MSPFFRNDYRGHMLYPATYIGFRIARNRKPVSPVEWVKIPAGKYTMGTSRSAQGFEDAVPAHKVEIKAFEISKTAVTVGQYAECMNKTKCSAPGTDEGCNWGKLDRQDHPVNCVDWNQANQYAGFAGARLISESEWEYAARSEGKAFLYPWGDSYPTRDLLVMGEKGTMPVCSRIYGNTEHGLCDMSGNVFQWLQDTYQPSYTGVPADGSAVNSNGELRVLRGSPFNNQNEWLMTTIYRFSANQGARYSFIGFRVAKSI